MTGIHCVKTTGERVFVLGPYDNPNTDVVSAAAKWVWVRRPCVGKRGLFHQTEQFRVDELETIDESLNRDMAEMILKAKKQQEALKAARKEEETQDAVPVNLLN